MNQILQGAVTALILFSIAFLIGSFTQVSFDIAEWEPTARGLVGILGGILSTIVGCIIAFRE